MSMIRVFLTVILMSAFLMVSAATLPAADKQEAAKAPVELSLDKGKTAILIMDYENDIVAMVPEQERGPLLDRAAAILKEARRAGMPVIYIVVRFRDGYPEVNPQNKLFSSLKESGRFREGTPGAEVNAKVAPQPGDTVVTKRRVGAFSTTDLETILRAKKIDTLVLFGISTSGVVLSTVRWAADMDYKMVVVADACSDRNEDVHRILTEKVFPWQATVMTTQEIIKAIGTK